jgi:RNA polymerase sigma factor (sigma-70 family)
VPQAEHLERRADAELVGAARAGDKGAFAELVNRHRGTALALASRILSDPDVAFDAVQEATVVAMVSLDRLRSPERFGAWLCGIALNLARRWLRQLRAASTPMPVQLVAVTTPEEQAEAADTATLVYQAVAQLPPGQRRAVLLFYWKGLTQAEVAVELGISLGAVKARMHQARAALEPRLSPLVEVEEVPTVSQIMPPGWVDVTVAEVRRGPSDDPVPGVHAVLLDEVGGDRRLPIYIAPPEATALALSLETTEMPRPMTYQLASSLVAASGAEVTEVRITRLVESTFYAVVVVAGPSGPTEVDARPSDALNLALVAGSPVRVDARLLDDPNATAYDAWEGYETGAAEIVSEVRRRQEEVMAAMAERRRGGASPPTSGRSP